MPGVHRRVLPIADLKPHLMSDRLLVGAAVARPSASSADRPVLAIDEVGRMSASWSPSSLPTGSLHRRGRRRAGAGRLTLAVPPAVSDCLGARCSPARQPRIVTPRTISSPNSTWPTAMSRTRLPRAAHVVARVDLAASWRRPFDRMPRRYCRPRSDRGPPRQSTVRRIRRVRWMRMFCGIAGPGRETMLCHVAPDVGGGSGPKLVFYPEGSAVALRHACCSAGR